MQTKFEKFTPPVGGQRIAEIRGFNKNKISVQSKM